MTEVDRSDEYRETWREDTGATILEELRDVLVRYVAFTEDHAAPAVALWIAVTHALPAFECAPRW
jgi:hypothetical protein